MPSSAPAAITRVVTTTRQHGSFEVYELDEQTRGVKHALFHRKQAWEPIKPLRRLKNAAKSLLAKRKRRAQAF